jgi:DNA-binding MarR family transcriptional regulator
MHDRRLIGALLRIPFQATVARVRDRLTGAGFTDLTMAHFGVFQHLPPGGARITELAAQAQMTKQSMGALVEHLEQRGYLERRPDPTDKRASVVDLTARGRALVEVAREAIQELEHEWEVQIGGDRMNHLRRTLRELISLIEAEQRAV